MAGEMRFLDAAQIEVGEDCAGREPCGAAGEGEGPAMTGQVVGDDPGRFRKMRGDPVPGAVRAAEAVQQDDCGVSLAHLGSKERGSHGLHPVQRRMRFAADTTASSEAATMLVLMPAPNILPPGCSTSM